MLLICVITFFAYSNTFSVPFQFDDIPNIVENPLIQSTGTLVDSDALCSGGGGAYKKEVLCNFFGLRYMGYATFALNYAVHGLRVYGYHMINLLIHILNSLLVYSILTLSFRTPLLGKEADRKPVQFIALFSALLFALHPVQTQAVTYIVQRFTILAAMFYLASLVCYIKWRLSSYQKSRPLNCLFYIGSLAFASMAMKTKEIAFTLPFIIALYEFIFFQEKLRRRILYLTPLMLTLLIIPYSLIDIGSASGLLQEVSERTRLLTAMSRLDYLFTEFRVIVTYIRLLVLPINQNLDYDYPSYHSFFVPGVFLSFILLFALFSAAIYVLYRLKKKGTSGSAYLISFGIIWFFITLSVESSVIPIVDVIFEHRLYLPSVGAFTAFTASVWIASDGIADRWRRSRAFATIVISVIILTLAVSTLMRNNVWRERTTLWEDVVRKSPAKLRGYIGLGYAYVEEGNYDKAIEVFKKAITINPTYAEAHYNLGCAFMNRGDIESARASWRKTLEIDPGHSYALNQMGTLSFFSDSFAEAEEYYSRALLSDYWNMEAHYNLALVSEKLNKRNEAVHHYEVFLKIVNPQYSHLIPEVRRKLHELREY